MTANRYRVLAVIPARGGSRRVPGKNIRPVAGRPLIAWTIAAARQAASLDRIVVSTDSEAIAAVARDNGVDVPELRPAALAQDDTPGIDPIVYTVERLSAHEGYECDFVMILQPTSPLRTAADIDAAIALLRTRHAKAVVSLCPVSQQVRWMRSIGPAGEVEPYAEPDAAERQRLERMFVLNGAIYLVEREWLLRTRSLYPEPTIAYVMPLERSIDVDTEWDRHLADLALRYPLDTTS